MNTEIIIALVAVVSTPIGGWVGTLFMRHKYQMEIEGLKADVTKKLADTRSTELDNVRQGNEILMQHIVEPLKIEIKSLRSDVNKFRKAIEKIPRCPMSSDCPVSRELLSNDKGDLATTASGK